MPIILQRDDYDLWLDPGMTTLKAVSHLLKPFDARSMRSDAVSNRVNQVVSSDWIQKPSAIAISRNRIFAIGSSRATEIGADDKHGEERLRWDSEQDAASYSVRAVPRRKPRHANRFYAEDQEVTNARA
jgi:hypothetical protein